MESNLESRKIELEEDTLKHLDITRKWAMFLAIIGFIFLGLIIIIGLIAGTFLTAFSSGEKTLGIPESLMFIPVFIMIVMYFFPVLFLFRFSKHASHAIKTFDKHELHTAIRNLKFYFVYIGILIILILSFYLILLFAAGSSMSFIKGL
jgi:hypothetical protein